MTPSSTVPLRFIGCDVGKHEIVAFDTARNTTLCIPNTPKDLSRFAHTLDAQSFVVCEATGGYEAALLEALLAARVPAHRADARKVKAFIRSFGTLGKTDAIDAKALARYGCERYTKLPLWHAPDKHRAKLQALVLVRSDLVKERTAYTNRLKAPGGLHGAAYLKKVCATIERQIQAVERDIAALVEDHEALAQSARVLQSIVGIGPTSAMALIALMPELGGLNRRQAAALAGLAPHPFESGTAKGYRKTRGGRPEVKRVLFMAALSAAKHNPELKTFHQRLCKNGKKPIVAITAVMRKLIIIANAKIRDEIKIQGKYELS
ncbi:IS110 family transposase [Magnetovibrio sp. PR-2]|uniref:IS110 family transposase n=1 Tax=Magnetovibrio sp. PR-2 TaxID=3120356 RepID=UPI002FCE2761